MLKWQFLILELIYSMSYLIFVHFLCTTRSQTIDCFGQLPYSILQFRVQKLYISWI